MSTAATRRNGKAASCEPCRKGKIRCDHRRPICLRCERRGIPTKCIYHPAPLTKSRAPIASSAGSVAFSDLSSPTLAAPRLTTTTSAYAPETGSTNAFSFAFPATTRRQGEDKAAEDASLPIVKGVLALLRHCSLIQMLLREYNVHAQAALVPGPIMMAFANSLPDTISSYRLDDPERNGEGLTALAKDIMRTTTLPAVITPETTVEDFTSLFKGPNLRLQTLALIYALTARSCLLGLARDDDKREDLMQSLAGCSATCIRLTRDIAPEADDVLIWAAFEDARLATHLDGDSSLRVYRRIGELATDMYALGVHRESAITFETPFFIAECRRKSFVAAYQLDKFFATLMDRPPRILRRYSDCKAPLDLSDEELLSSHSEEQALLKVTSDGWNAEGKCIPATWQRLRFELGTFREEILQYRLRPSNSANNAELRSLSQRCRRFLDSLPNHLRYTPECWESGLSDPVCLMLTSSHLNMLQGEFQIQRLLEISDPASSVDLLHVAAETVATVLQIGIHLNRAIFLRHDFPYMTLTYGLHTAFRLAAALKSDARGENGPGLPASLSRSLIIRNLSVYTSYLESIFTPADGNYQVCRQAAKSLSRTLDYILETPAKANPLTPSSANGNAASGQASASLHGQDMTWEIDAFGMGDHDVLNGADLEAFDLASWAKTIDWGSGDWNAL